MRTTRSVLTVVAAVMALAITGCSNATTESPATSAAASTDASAAASAPAPSASASAEGEPAAAANSLEGKKAVLLISGDRNDNGFQQGQVEGFLEASERLGFEAIVIDKVDPGAAKDAFDNAVRQQPALLMSGGAELMDGFEAVCNDPQNAGTFFISVADFPPSCAGAVHYNADAFQVYYLSGVAAGLLLQRPDAVGDFVGVVTGPELTFVTTQLGAMEEGLKAQNPEAGWKINFTGSFNDSALAGEAAKAFIGQGAGLLTSYMSTGKVGAIEAAKASGTPILANSWDGCARPEGNTFAGSQVINLSAPMNVILDRYVGGELTPGSLYIFPIGTPGVDANICDATPEEQAVLDATREQILSGAITIASGGFEEQPDGTWLPRG